MNARPHLGAFAAQFPKENDKCPGRWARLELTEPLCRAQHGKALAFLSTTEFSIDGSWLNKRKLPSSSLRRNFSFLTTSTPSTAAITSPEKSHAFARSSCSHRLMFFFGVNTKGTKTMMIPDRSYTKTYKLIIGNSDTFSGSILSAANFGIRDSSLRSFRILFMIFSSFTSYR